MKKKERTRADIKAATVLLIEQTGSADITVSMIAKEADVSVGLINYHYESKQALIIDAVDSYVSERIQKDNIFIPTANMTPLEILTASFKSYADFLVGHAVLSRLHIRFCLEGAIDSGAAKQAVDYYLPLIEKCGNLTPTKAITALRMISSTVQMSFLEVGIKSEGAFDFFDKNQRDIFIDDMISLVITQGEAAGI